MTQELTTAEQRDLYVVEPKRQRLYDAREAHWALIKQRHELDKQIEEASKRVQDAKADLSHFAPDAH